MPINNNKSSSSDGDLIVTFTLDFDSNFFSYLLLLIIIFSFFLLFFFRITYYLLNVTEEKKNFHLTFNVYVVVVDVVAGMLAIFYETAIKTFVFGKVHL
jgi:undecaprenyl pyrophosphate phosphatase UppP